jgi:biopolymer transport protein ExbD
MTPMIDMMFQLVLFLLINISFVKEPGVEVRRPTAKTATADQKATVMVAVLANGDIWIDKQAVDVRLLSAHIERLHAENPEGAAVILADRDARAGLLVKVMDQIRIGGIGDISIAASTERDGP